MTSERKPCHFCGSTDRKMTKEHVFGEWIGGVIETRRSQRLRVDTYDVASQDITSTAYRETPEALHEIEVRAMCDPCNTVWGSQLEARAGQVLPRMIAGESFVATATEARDLAVWATKVAVMRDLLNPREARQIPDHVARRLRATNEPPRDGVSIVAFPTDADRWWVRTRLQHGAPDPRPHGGALPDRPDSFVSILTLHRVGIAVGYSRTRKEPRLLASEIPMSFVRLWPSPTGFAWPRPISLSDRELDILAANPRGWF